MPEKKKDSKAYGIYDDILILSDIEVHAKRDMTTLMTFGPKNVQVFTNGAAAIDYITDNPVDLIFCDSSLEDMSGIKFVQTLNTNMSGRPLPIIMVTLENKKAHVLDSIAAGCIGYILRPYSLDTFEKYLILAKQLDHYPEIEEMELQEAKDMVKRGDFDEAIEAFEELISSQDEAQKYYDLGCQFLAQTKYGKAIVSFKKAVKINDLFAEAYKGLADAYKGRGNVGAFKKYLKKAADVHAQFDRLEETRALFIEILKYDSDTPNPFNTLGVNLRKQGDYPGALHAYGQALELTPMDENIHFNMAKALYYMGKLEEASQKVVDALARNHKFTEANKLYQRIHGKPWAPPAGKIPEPRPVHEGVKQSARDLD